MSSKYRQRTAISVGVMLAIAASGPAHAASPAALSKSEAVRATALAEVPRVFNAAPAKSVRKPRHRRSIRRSGRRTASASASAQWYGYQLDYDRNWDAIRWWNGYRWTGYYWLDTNNDGTWGETFVEDLDQNGTGDLFWLRRGNSGNWAALVDVAGATIYQGQNEQGTYGQQYPGYGAWWRAQGYYQATVGPPSSPSGAYNLAISFARQGLVYYQ